MHSALRAVILLAAALAFAKGQNLVSSSPTSKMTPPKAKIETVVDDYHGHKIADPYRWLENARSPETQRFVEEQNAYAAQVLNELPGREKLRARLGQLLSIGRIEAPEPAGPYYFYEKREGQQNQPVIYVREGLNAKDRVLLDVNALAADGTVALDWWYPSRDGLLLAYGLSHHGSEQSVLRVRDVRSGQDLPDVIERTRACALSWLLDGSGFYYTRYPSPGSVPAGEEVYHRRVFLHRLGDDPARDIEVFGAGRPMEDWPDARLSPDGRWLVLTI